MKGLLASILVLVLLLFPFQANAQGKTVGEKTYKLSFYGKVRDSFTGAYVPSTITLMKADSTVILSRKTELSVFITGYNYFLDHVDVGKGETFIIKAEAKGYKNASVNKTFANPSRLSWIEFPTIYMHRQLSTDSQELDEVNVTGTLVKMIHKKDTLIFNAQAFKLPEGSMLDGLIKQLPGTELKDNGDILVNGRKIDNLTLNGDDFFKGNNSVMLENLPYYTVNQIKVYDKQTARSKMMGEDVEPREYTMDVVLKKEYNRGSITNAEVGGGTKERYTAQAFHLTYDDLNRLSVYGNMNNLNKNPRPGNKGNWKPEDLKEGENTSKKVGLDFQTKNKKENIKEHFTTEFAWLKNNTDKESFMQQYTTTSDIFGHSRNQLLASNFNWKADNELSIGKLEWTAGADYKKMNSHQLLSDSTYTLEDYINHSTTSINDRKHEITLNTEVSYGMKLPWGDKLLLVVNGSYGSERYESENNKAIAYNSAANSQELRLLTGNSPAHNYSFKGSAEYCFNLKKAFKFYTTLGYAQSYLFNQADYLNNGLVDINSFNSGLFKRTGDIKFKLSRFKLGPTIKSFDISADFKRVQDHYTIANSASRYNQTRWTWQPSFSARILTIDEPKREQYRVTYDASIIAPEMSMMYGPENTVDPLVTIYRSSNLKSSIKHNVWANYNKYFKWHNFNVAPLLKVNATQNKVSYKKAVDRKTGKYYFKPGNVNGNWDGELYLRYGLDIDSAGIFSFAGYTSFDYVHHVDFDIANNLNSDQLSKVNTGRFWQNLKLTYKKKEFQLSLCSRITAAHVSSNRANFSNFNYQEYLNEISMNAPLFWKLKFVTDFGIYSRRGYREEIMNTDDVVWNASISRNFLKNKLIVSLEAYDLLHQLSKNSIVINSQARTETRVNTLPDYLMLRLQYHFSKKPKKRK